MAQDKISMPSSMGGITRYLEEEKSRFHLKPTQVLIIIAVVMLIEFILHAKGNSWFGI